MKFCSRLTYSVWDVSDTIDKLNEFNFSRDSWVEYLSRFLVDVVFGVVTVAA